MITRRRHERDRRERRRAQIVEAASTIFRGRDPNTVRFEEVADAADGPTLRRARSSAGTA
jgi:AcrR family transcriptional regulator